MRKRNIYKFLLSAGVLLANLACQAQQEVMYTQYMFNGLALNPAYAGSHEAVSMTFLARDQWNGIPGAPSTQTFSIHSPVKKSFALGLQVIHDNLTVFDQYGVNASYAYKIRTHDGIWSLGVQAGFTNYSAELTQLTTDQADPLFAQDVSKMMPSLGAGVYYHTKNFYIGASVPQFLSDDLYGDEVTFTNDPDVFQDRHYFLTSGYVFDLSRNVKFKPNVLFKMVEGAPLAMDVNGSVLFHEVLWLGLSWRSFSDIDALLELQLTDNLLFGYSYDFATTTDLRRVNSGSHEIMLNYIFGQSKDWPTRPKYRTKIRYF